MIDPTREAGRTPASHRREEPAGPSPRRRRGRPPRLSREGIVDAVLVMLERDPGEPLTIARIAREVEAVSAALYRHFENLDDLLESVLTRVLEASESELDESEAWEAQLEGWMRGLRSHLLQYPAVIALLDRSGRTSPAWLDASSVLVEILGRAGLCGDDLASTYLWILEMTVGLVMQEAVVSVPEQVANARASRRELSARARARFLPIAPALERLDGETFFTFVVQQTIAIVAMRRRTSRRP